MAGNSAVSRKIHSLNAFVPISLNCGASAEKEMERIAVYSNALIPIVSTFAGIRIVSRWDRPVSLN